MNKLLVVLSLSTLLLLGCLDREKKFACEHKDGSGRTSLIIKGDKATLGSVAYNYACKPSGNFISFGAMKDSCEGPLDDKNETWFLIQFDEVAGTLIESDRTGEFRSRYTYNCKKAE